MKPVKLQLFPKIKKRKHHFLKIGCKSTDFKHLNYISQGTFILLFIKQIKKEESKGIFNIP